MDHFLHQKKNFLFLGALKFFIPRSDKRVPEIIDMQDKDFKCANLPQAPHNRGLGGAALATLGGIMYICGGFSGGGFESMCWMMENKSWQETARLTMRRYTLGFSTIGNKIIISGGRNSWNAGVSGIEVYTKDGGKALGVNLPHSLHSHCQVSLNATTVLTIGGVKNGKASTDTTTFINVDEEKVSDGPTLPQGRYGLGCTEFEFNGKEYVVIIGGIPIEKGEVNSVEYLPKDEPTKWIKGKDFPIKITDAVLIPSESKLSFYVIGGAGHGVDRGAIYQSDCSGESVTDCSFKKIETRISGDNEGIAISNEMADELCSS